MAARSGSQGDGSSDDSGEAPVGVYESRPGRVVFIEEGNTDAWIATDGAVEARP